jgi:hypothetical protein
LATATLLLEPAGVPNHSNTLPSVSNDPMTRGREFSRLQRELNLSDEAVATAAGLRLEEYVAIKRGAGNPSRRKVVGILQALVRPHD